MSPLLGGHAAEVRLAPPIAPATLAILVLLVPTRKAEREARR